MARLRAEPSERLIDEVPEIIVSGVQPGAEVRIDVAEVDANQERWSSWAVLKASATGTASTSQPAIAGTYTGADEAGVFWSMRPTSSGLAYRAPGDVVISVVEASIGGELLARLEARRLVAGPGVRRSDVAQDGLQGVLFEPSQRGGIPVITLQGSRGGVDEGEAALLASHGFTAFALSYFGYPGQPSTLADIPLEYFAQAARWLLKIAGGRARCALIGQSRGGELVLLLAATFPELFGPVVATAPSSQVWGGMGEEVAAWRMGGDPVPFMDAAEPATPLRDVPPPIRLATLFERAMNDREQMDATAIRIERATCPILLLSGADDAMWPSADFAERVTARLARCGYRQTYRHVSFPDAGHTLSGVPNTPVMTHSIHPVALLDFAYGGMPAGIARARRDAWRLRTEFLASADAQVSDPRA